jgi:hypothetical protein
VTIFIIRSRQGGKTQALINWVRQGHEIDSWPYWSRVIITHDMQSAVQLRNKMREAEVHRVFYLEEWHARHYGYNRQREPLEIAIDNADIILRNLLDDSLARMEVVTATGETK